MHNEDYLNYYQELINLGISEDIALEAALIYLDSESALNYIDTKFPTFSDPKQELDQNISNNLKSTNNESKNDHLQSPSKLNSSIYQLSSLEQNSPFLNSPKFSSSISGDTQNPLIMDKTPAPQHLFKDYSDIFDSPLINNQNFINPKPNQLLLLESQSSQSPKPHQDSFPQPVLPPSINIPQSLQSSQSLAPTSKLQIQNLPSFESIKPQKKYQPWKIPPPPQAPSFLNFPKPAQASSGFQSKMLIKSDLAHMSKNNSSASEVDSNKIQGLGSQEHKSLENEDIYEFMTACLRLRGRDEETIKAVCDSCTSKEEAMMKLDIPIHYKSMPLADIPSQYIFPEPNSYDFETNSLTQNPTFKIKKDLLNLGVSKNLAEELSKTCSTSEEAVKLLFDDMESEIFKEHIHKPKPPSAAQSGYYNPYPNYHILNPPQSSSSYKSNQRPLVLSQPSEEDPIAPEIKTNYFESLKNFRLILSESPEIFKNFILGSVNSSGPQFTRRINKEIKSIESSVPCDSTASIFTLIDEKCMHRIYFLLSGTKDTPYSHGLYLFEVLLPENYPNSPPKVRLVTTGNGSIRFNPNLYESGYICLSIINTWSGRPEEQWNPEFSTLLQVMLSIQSLVMDNNIIHKEPGFNNYPSYYPENLTYQYEVKYGNIKYAMIENIRKPPLGFEEVIRNHFKCKKEEILKTVDKWTQEMTDVANIGETFQNLKINAEINRIGPYKAFNDLYSELNSLLNNL